MVDEHAFVHQRVQSFLHSGQQAHCLLLGFDHHCGKDIVVKALHPFYKNSLYYFIRLDFDFLCWSPEHFDRQSKLIIQRIPIADISVKNDHNFDVPSLIQFLDHLSKNHHQKFVVMVENIQQLQILLHYKQNRNLFDEMRLNLRQTSSILFIMLGRPPFRREKEYQNFISSFDSNVLYLEAINADGTKKMCNEQGLDLSNDLITLIYEKTGGIRAYIQFIINAIHHSNQSTKKAMKTMVESVIDSICDEHSLLHQSVSLRYLLSIEQAKGYGGIRTILSSLTKKPDRTLTQIAETIDKSPSATKDYLDSLCEIGLITKISKKYSITDPILHDWLRFSEQKWSDPFLDHLFQEKKLTSMQKPVPTYKKLFHRKQNDKFIEYD